MVEQYKKGKLVDTFINIAEAERQTGIPSTNISKVIRGKRGHAGGFSWKIRNEPSGETTYNQDLEKGTLKVDTYYDHPPQPSEVIADHQIDEAKWKLSSFYSKAKAKGWLVTALFSNLQSIDRSRMVSEEYVDAAVKKYISPTNFKATPPKNNSRQALRIIITDAHIGMDVSGGVFGGVWNVEELTRRGEVIVQNALTKSALHGGFDEIQLIDLGDYVDGLNGETVRGGHKLPQNLTNEEAFDAGVDFKVRLISSLLAIPHSKFTAHNICVDNHAGSFGYFINSAVKRIAETKWDVEIINHTNFLSHYNYGKATFLVTHGKDEKDLSKGWPAKLDSNTVVKIDDYLKHNNLYKPGQNIIIEKGDSHQQILDHATSTDFKYHAYMALSPPSAWVTKNFSKSMSGANIMIVDKDTGEFDIRPIYF